MHSQYESRIPILATVLGLFFLLLPSSHSEPSVSATQINSYLLSKSSPLSGDASDNGAAFISSGLASNVDPRLIVAIAGAETTFGTGECRGNPVVSTNNAWNWFYCLSTVPPSCGDNPCLNSQYPSWADGIRSVSHSIGRWIVHGRDTIPKIGHAYCKSGCENWVTNVTRFYHTELGGDLANLRFSANLTLLDQRSHDREFPGGPGFIIGQTFALPLPALITNVETLLREGYARCGRDVQMSIWRLNSSSGDLTQGANLVATSSNAVDPNTFDFGEFTFTFSEPVPIQALAYYFWGVYAPLQDCDGPSVAGASVNQVAGDAWRLYGNVQDPDTFRTLSNLSLYQKLPDVNPALAIADFYQVISGRFQ